MVRPFLSDHKVMQGCIYVTNRTRLVATAEAAETRFAHIKVHGWRQFADVEIEFDESLTIITGANGAGKTTLLNLLAPHVGWNVPFVSFPTALRGVAQLGVQFATNVWAAFASNKPASRSEDEFGEVGFASGAVSKIAVA